jgi:hypothetical protein
MFTNTLKEPAAYTRVAARGNMVSDVCKGSAGAQGKEYELL